MVVQNIVFAALGTCVGENKVDGQQASKESC
jgi:hypothetical protein